MNEMDKLFKNLDNGYIMFDKKIIGVIIDISSKNWFNAQDTAIVLGYKDPKQTIKKYVEKEDKDQIKNIKYENIKMLYEHPDTVYLSEAGLYSLILRSNLPSAKKFKNWVTREVLPSIHKYDVYKVKRDFEDKMKQNIKKINFLLNENNKLKSHMRKEKYPQGGLVYVMDYKAEHPGVYRIGMTSNMVERKRVYDTHTLYNRPVSHKYFTQCPSQFESCVLSLLYNYRFDDRKDYFECNLKKIKKVFKVCKKSIKCIECTDICANNSNNDNTNIVTNDNIPQSIDVETMIGGYSKIIDKIINSEMKKYRIFDKEIKSLNNSLKEYANKINFQEQ